MQVSGVEFGMVVDYTQMYLYKYAAILALIISSTTVKKLLIFLKKFEF